LGWNRFGCRFFRNGLRCAVLRAGGASLVSAVSDHTGLEAAFGIATGSSVSALSMTGCGLGSSRGVVSISSGIPKRS